MAGSAPFHLALRNAGPPVSALRTLVDCTSRDNMGVPDAVSWGWVHSPLPDMQRSEDGGQMAARW